MKVNLRQVNLIFEKHEDFNKKLRKEKLDYENRLSKKAKSDPKLLFAYVRIKKGVKE